MILCEKKKSSQRKENKINSSIFGIHLLDNNADKWSNKHKCGSEANEEEKNENRTPHANVRACLKARKRFHLNEMPIIYPVLHAINRMSIT